MNEDRFNMDMRKFLKKTGITSQREIEKAVYDALNSGQLQGNEILETRVTLVVDKLDLQCTITGQISLDD